jgi:hypothetical protein
VALVVGPECCEVWDICVVHLLMADHRAIGGTQNP